MLWWPKVVHLKFQQILQRLTREEERANFYLAWSMTVEFHQEESRSFLVSSQDSPVKADWQTACKLDTKQRLLVRITSASTVPTMMALDNAGEYLTLWTMVHSVLAITQLE